MKASKIKTYLTILLILWAILQPIPPAQPTAMKRESLTLDEALYTSLFTGDGRRVDWSSVRWEV